MRVVSIVIGLSIALFCTRVAAADEFRRDGTLVISDQREVYVYAPDSKLAAHFQAAEPIATVRFDRAGNLLITSTDDYGTHLWRYATNGRLLATLRGAADEFDDFAVLADGKSVAGTGQRDTLDIWDLDRARIRTHTKIPAKGRVTIISDALGLLVTSHGTAAQLWSLQPPRRLWTLPDPFSFASISPDGRWLTNQTGDSIGGRGHLGTFEILSIHDRRKVLEASGGAPQAAVYDPTGTWVACTFTVDNANLAPDRYPWVEVWNIAAHTSFRREMRGEISGNNSYLPCAVSANRFVYANAGLLVVDELPGGRELFTRKQAEPVRKVIISPDGKTAAVVCVGTKGTTIVRFTRL